MCATVAMAAEQDGSGFANLHPACGAGAGKRAADPCTSPRDGWMTTEV